LLKKAIAILILAVLLFTTVGYRVIISLQQWKADKALVATINDGAYNQNLLLTIKVPINIPYQNSWTSFERVEGEIEIEGVHYTYVQRKIENDTLILQCLPNTGRNDIKKAATKYFASINDLDNQSRQNSSKSSLAKAFKVEFIGGNIWSVTGFIKQKLTYPKCLNDHYKSIALAQIFSPPKQVA